MAPVKKPINWQEVEEGMMAGCTQENIAGSQHVDRDTLRNRFFEEYGIEYSAYSALMLGKGQTLIEVAQMQKALNSDHPGNSQMLMYLGKVKYGQTEDKPASTGAPNDDKMEAEDAIMLLKNENAEQKKINEELQAKLNAIQNQSQAE